jgi:hypothetical protein
MSSALRTQSEVKVAGEGPGISYPFLARHKDFVLYVKLINTSHHLEVRVSFYENDGSNGFVPTIRRGHYTNRCFREDTMLFCDVITELE